MEERGGKREGERGMREGRKEERERETHRRGGGGGGGADRQTKTRVGQKDEENNV